jgi:hypothetical protein
MPATRTATTTAVPATETGISSAASRAIAVAAPVALAAVLAGCGRGGTTASGPGTSASGASGGAAVFAGLRPAPPPATWRIIHIPSGAAVAYPPNWRRVKSDVDTASAALIGPGDQILGYLNITPQQGGETLANWSRFRVDHNGEEGDRAIVTRAAAGGLRFRTGRGSCVRDSYTTRTANHYTELACLVAGPRASTVVVGAAPTKLWIRISPLLERAISSITT